MSDDDNFRVFRSKKSRYRQKYQQKSIENTININSDDFDLDETLRNINRHLVNFRETSYSVEWLDQVEGVINTIQSGLIIELYCLGLGRFASDFQAKIQFIFVVTLAERFKINKLYFYDPVFRAGEKKLLEKFEYILLDENTEGKFEITKERLNIIFFPHSPISLTNNFLWKNWNIDSLEKIIYIGNSFQSLVTDTLNRNLDDCSYIKRAEEFVNEIKLEYRLDVKYADILHSISIHWFSRAKLLEQPLDLWQDIKEPIYKKSQRREPHEILKKKNGK